LDRSGIERILRWEVAAALLLVALWACNPASAPAEERISTPTITLAPASTVERSEPTQSIQSTVGVCEEPATEISLGEAVSAEIVGHDQPPPERKYFCVRVSDGVSSITFELAGATSDLNLYVGYPDLETVQQGGFTFWASDEQGIEDKTILIEPALTDYVNPGPYYIEVSAQDFRASSPFTLTVQVP
jgi:hypothetical protein